MINEQSARIEELEKKTRTELQDARLIAEHAAELGAKKAITDLLGMYQQQQPQQIPTQQDSQQQQAQPQSMNVGGIPIPTNLIQNLDSKLINQLIESIMKHIFPNSEENPLGYDFADYKRFKDIRDGLFREKMRQVAKAVEREFQIRLPPEASEMHEVV